jgi:predicted ATPase
MASKALPNLVLDEIVRRTDGVPLFIEELTKAILEGGLLRESHARYELDGPVPGLAIPATLHASLLARLDRPRSVNDVVQISAAVGREFSWELVAAVSGLSQQELESAFEKLVQAGLIFQRGVPPNATYVFKHALVRDVAYAGLLRGRRTHVHGQIAHALEHRPEVAESEPELLAHHLTEAGLWEAAVPYWLKAGQRAVARSALLEAADLSTLGAFGSQRVVCLSLMAGVHFALDEIALAQQASACSIEIARKTRHSMSTALALVTDLLTPMPGGLDADRNKAEAVVIFAKHTSSRISKCGRILPREL